MRIIKRNLEKDFIYLDEIKVYKHILICKVYGDVYILRRKNYGQGLFQWILLNNEFTKGNRLTQEFRSMREAIENFIDNSNAEMQVFEDWKEALKWAVKD